MTLDKKHQLFGKVEHQENKGMDWMFKKARELGFSELEVKQLKSIYHSKKSADNNCGS